MPTDVEGGGGRCDGGAVLGGRARGGRTRGGQARGGRARGGHAACSAGPCQPLDDELLASHRPGSGCATEIGACGWRSLGPRGAHGNDGWMDGWMEGATHQQPAEKKKILQMERLQRNTRSHSHLLVPSAPSCTPHRLHPRLPHPARCRFWGFPAFVPPVQSASAPLLHPYLHPLAFLFRLSPRRPIKEGGAKKEKGKAKKERKPHRKKKRKG